MEFRNPVYNSDGTIECEVEFPPGIWGPFTAGEHDPELHGRELFGDIVAAGGIAPYVAPAALTPDWPALINVERERRLLANFRFAGVAYDFDQVSKTRIAGASLMSFVAMSQGATAGNPYWHGGATPFVWVAADNSLNVMDAQTCFAFGQAAADHDRAHIYAAYALRAMDPVPADFTADGYWPTVA